MNYTGRPTTMWMDDVGEPPWSPTFGIASSKSKAEEWMKVVQEGERFAYGLPDKLPIAPPLNAFDARAAIKRHQNEIKHVEEKLAKLKFELFILEQGLEQVEREGDLDVSKLIEEANNACDQL